MLLKVAVLYDDWDVILFADIKDGSYNDYMVVYILLKEVVLYDDGWNINTGGLSCG